MVEDMDMEAIKDMAQAMDVSPFSLFDLLFIDYFCLKSEHLTNLTLSLYV